jgi:hypothetical protein
MIGSSILNSVYFLDQSGSYPNETNTLHINRKHGNSFIICYSQRFDKDDVITLQFYSDSATIPVLKSYLNVTEIEEIALSDSNTIVGDITRYYYNFEVTLGASYYDKKVTFVVTQDTFHLDSEPVKIEDLTEDINNGKIKILQYSNYDRQDTDLEGYFYDFSIVTEPLFIYVEGVDRKINDDEKSETLKGSDQESIISASLFSGISFETGIIPPYRVRQLKAISMLDFFALNGLEYVKQNTSEETLMGSSTSYTTATNLVQKSAMMINTDDLGIENMEREWHKSYTARGVFAGFDVEIPAGYMLHWIGIKHSTTSSGNPATVTAGSSLGGTQYFDGEAGTITGAERYSFTQHDGYKSLVSIGRVYIAMSGASIKLDIDILFELIP